jgi:hypothetical protein
MVIDLIVQKIKVLQYQKAMDLNLKNLKVDIMVGLTLSILRIWLVI